MLYEVITIHHLRGADGGRQGLPRESEGYPAGRLGDDRGPRGDRADREPGSEAGGRRHSRVRDAGGRTGDERGEDLCPEGGFASYNFV